MRWRVLSTRMPEHGVAALAIGQDVTADRARHDGLRRTAQLAATGTLMAGLAHEIRNPLNNARLQLSWLARRMRQLGADQEVLDAVRVVGAETQRLADLVTEFLAFARPAPMRRTWVAVPEVAARVHRRLQERADASRTRLAVSVVGDVPRAFLDEARIEQALDNVVENAVEATAGREGGHVTTRILREGECVVVEVEDDGPGTVQGDAPVFDAFYTTKPRGTGMGLAIAHRAATDHDGSLTFESQPARTVFRFALPIDGSSRANRETVG
jgi:signal transduction histidine kinase